MTPRRMTTYEALSLIEEVWEIEPDLISTGLIEAFVGDTDVGTATMDLESWLAGDHDDIDLSSISITPDVVEGTNLSAVKITIKTEDQP